jgi:hypothetical protein
MFFFEKKNQKTFPGAARRHGTGRRPGAKPRSARKGFLVLFFKKEPLSCLSL